jgi:hypothetical protein
MNILSLFRRHPRETIVIGGLLVVILIVRMARMITWPLLPIGQSDPIGIWEKEPNNPSSVHFTITDHEVLIQPQPEECCSLEECCQPIINYYPIHITSNAIVYSDRPLQQSYRVGTSILSLFIGDRRQTRLVIATPGPIPMGTYTLVEFETPPLHWDPSP